MQAVHNKAFVCCLINVCHTRIVGESKMICMVSDTEASQDTVTVFHWAGDQSESKFSNTSAHSMSLLCCRGQVIRVKAPWVKHYYHAGTDSYIIPNTETVVLGGTLQKGNWDTSISKEVCILLVSQASSKLSALQ